MKKVICAIGIIVLIYLVYLLIPDYVLRGYTDSEEYYDKNGFQDYTDFCIYRYDSAEKFIYSRLYNKVSENDVENIRSYFDNFKGWMEAENRLDEYSFDSASVSAGDYYHIETKEGEPIGQGKYSKFDNYSIYFFDVESKTLYYIHTNI